jgi:hypothetical protein
MPNYNPFMAMASGKALKIIIFAVIGCLIKIFTHQKTTFSMGGGGGGRGYQFSFLS